jgi:hypothetical protein
MKKRISLALFVLLLTPFASAADKYVSTEFGFAASFPANVVRSQINSDAASFTANAPGGAWVAEVKVAKNVAMPKEITKAVMAARLANVLKEGGMTQVGSTSLTTFQDHPTLLATATFIVNNQDTNFVAYPVVVDIKLIFVSNRNLTKGQNRVYTVSGRAIQGKDRSAIQPFLDSFELR